MGLVMSFITRCTPHKHAALFFRLQGLAEHVMRRRGDAEAQIRRFIGRIAAVQIIWASKERAKEIVFELSGDGEARAMICTLNEANDEITHVRTERSQS